MKKSIFKPQTEDRELTPYEKIMALERKLNVLKRRLQGEKVKMYILVDCNGQELEFPDIDERLADNPGIKPTAEEGDTIVVDGKYGESGECLMPDGETTIIFENGKVTEIIIEEDINYDNASLALNEVVFCSKGKELRIFSPNDVKALEIGNIVSVNGISNQMLGRFKIENKWITVNKGQITSVKKIEKPLKRSLFKNK